MGSSQRILITAVTSIAFLHMVLFIGVARCEFPEKPVIVVVGFAAGGTTDILTRAIAVEAEKYLGQPIIVENKPGGAGTVALAVIATTKPDGYTLCAIPSDSIVNTPQLQKVPYKPLNSFSGILGFSNAQNCALIVKSDAPWKTFREFLNYAKNNPGKIKYSTSGVGTLVHLAMEYIAYKEGVKWVHVPTKGTAPANLALLGGHVDACSAGQEFNVHARAGTVRVLATYGEKKSPLHKNVPTLKELGFDFVKDSIFGIVGPARISAQTVGKLSAALVKGMEGPKFKSLEEELDMTPCSYIGNDFDRRLKELWTTYETMFKDTGIIKEPATQPY